MQTRLGLDMGTNSLGWCLLKLDDNNEPCEIIKAGVRIFSDGRESKSMASLKADRRVARSARRRRDRYLIRRKALMKILIEENLMPSSEADRKELEKEDPYAIRARAIQGPVRLFEMGRALFHLNQRRGFKSNRKTADKEDGVVKTSISELKARLEEKNKKTIGAFLAERKDDGYTVRARRLGTARKDLYELYPERSMYEHEFDEMWETQAKHAPEDYSDAKRDRIRIIIFFQRPLKKPIVGRCTFLPDEDRAPKALPSFQKFRIYQELHNLRWIDRWGKGRNILECRALRDALAELLMKQQKLSFSAMSRIMKKMGIVDYKVTFNLQSEKRKAMDGDCVSSEMRKPELIGAEWDDWDLDKQDALISLLLNDEASDEEVSEALVRDYAIPEEDKDRIQKIIDVKLPVGYGMLSKKAIDKIVPVMVDQDLHYWDAVKEAGLGAHNLYDASGELQPRLDYYGAALTGDVLPGSGDPKHKADDVKFYGAIPNPTVHIALNQIRQVLNELIRLYGKPHQIVVELARELPQGADGRREIVKEQGDNQKSNERIVKELENLRVDVNLRNIRKFKLWEQISEDPADRCCVFCGEMIGIHDLFGSSCEIEHILPFSKTLDDTMANKTISCRRCNREKGNRSPYEAFGGENSRWEGIMARATNLPDSKAWRFAADAMQKHEKEDGFLARQLNDTRYISRYTREYLATVVPQKDIWVVTGRLTALLRKHWGLNGILRGDNATEEEKRKKSRDDHRHHAVDAVVVGMCSRAMVQRLSRSARRGEALDGASLFGSRDEIDPWLGFRHDVRAHMADVIVSHRARKKSQGALHNETAYGLRDETAVKRVSVKDIKDRNTIRRIVDREIKEALEKEVLGLEGKDFRAAVEQWCKDRVVGRVRQKDGSTRTLRGIRRLRTYDNTLLENMIPVKDREGRTYKYLKGNGNAWMDIYINERGKWDGETVKRFDANQKGFVPAWQREHPTAKKVMRLRINDSLKLKHNGEERLMRVQLLTGKKVILAPITEANAAARYKEKNDTFKFTSKAPSVLQEYGACKVHISPTGLVREAK